MRKLILLAGLFTLLSISLEAQKLGFIGGPSMNHGYIRTENADASYKPILGVGFHVGGLFEMDITNRWGFDAAVMYDMRNTAFQTNYNESDTSNHFSRQLFYLNVPLHIYVNVPIQNKYVLSFFVGPSISIGLHGNDAAWLMTDSRKPLTSFSTDMFDKDEGRVLRFEIAAEIGMAFKYREFQARIAYQYGLNNTNANGYQFTMPITYNTKNSYRQGSLRLSFAYLFDLSR